MRINTTPESDLIPFRDTLIGDVFAHKGTICIKIEKINTHITENAVALLYGYTITFKIMTTCVYIGRPCYISVHRRRNKAAALTFREDHVMKINELSAEIADEINEPVSVVSKVLRCLNARTIGAFYKWVRKALFILSLCLCFAGCEF